MRVYFIGYQETFAAPIALFNLLDALPGHPVESTVSAQTLRAHGWRVPSRLTKGKRISLHILGRLARVKRA